MRLRSETIGNQFERRVTADQRGDFLLIYTGRDRSNDEGVFARRLAALDGAADGIADALDNCPGTFNPSQADDDGDGLGDACDVAPPP
jgi:hypothetical protein